jgi:hypothetical protein
MRRLTLVVLCLAYPAHLFGQTKDADEKRAFEKLWARCVDSSALVFGLESTKERQPIAGALVLDREKHLLLSLDYDLPDHPTVVFPTYTAKGELRNKPSEYVELWKKGERWKGKVQHRDKYRGLVVIELDRALPDRAKPAEFARQSAAIGSTIHALGQLPLEPEASWNWTEGKVRGVGKEVPIVTGHEAPHPPSRMILTSTAPRGSGPEFGLFNLSGHVVAFPEPSSGTPRQVEVRLDVTEVRAFLIENKVPFKSAEEPAAKDKKAK